MLTVVVAITLLPRSCARVRAHARVRLWTTGAGPDDGKTWPPFPSSIVLPLPSRRLCLELGCCPSCRTVPYSQWHLSYLLRGVPSPSSCNSIVPVSRFLGGPAVAPSLSRPQGALWGGGLCGSLSSFPLPPILPASPAVLGATDHSCLTGLFTCHRSLRGTPSHAAQCGQAPGCSFHVPFSYSRPPFLLPLPLVQTLTHFHAHHRICLLLVGERV